MNNYHFKILYNVCTILYTYRELNTGKDEIGVPYFSGKIENC